MPKRKDFKNILIIGAGPIVIGQACEFDYSGTQACKALKEEGYKVILINSNPATIMTDPNIADVTYIESITPENIKKIIIREKVEAILPTIGGQVALNTTLKVAKEGDFLKKHNVKLIGASLESIEKAEDRELFKKTMKKIGIRTCYSKLVKNLKESNKIINKIKFPLVIRPSYTLGGTGGSIVYNLEEYKTMVEKGLKLSMTHEVIVEESILGWKEYELEVMRDCENNVVIVCSIENIDPVGVHTGDSITVAPQQTLTDKEYQNLRNMTVDIIREIGVSTGGANVQFAVHPETRDVIVIEMNPRVSRSSALASKATGFPIAKIASKLAVGYTLEEIPNDITKTTPSCFEPTIDYVVTKMPRFAFEKFPSTSKNLGIQMKSVGETMAIGRTFKESFQKAFRGLQKDTIGYEGVIFSYEKINEIKNKKKTETISKENQDLIESLQTKIIENHYKKINYIKDCFFLGLSVDKVYSLSKIDPWFLHQFKDIVTIEKQFLGKKLQNTTSKELLTLKQNGFSDDQLSLLFQTNTALVRKKRNTLNIKPSFKMVDTCAGEFVAKTPYYYSNYDEENDYIPSKKKEKIIILGSGPNQIGQGIEFDYMCVKASLALKEMKYESIIINSNPETVSTDYDVSDTLFFDPLTYEDVFEIIDFIKPKGILIQFGGQIPLNLSQKLSNAGIPILGTQSKSISMAEDRNTFKKVLNQLQFKQPTNAIIYSLKEALSFLKKIDFPLLIRPSFVLGGRAMEIVYNEADFKKYILEAIRLFPNQPILIDKYLENAIELDVDAICDGQETIICGIMEHIEEAGIHSGDSACVLPPYSINPSIIEKIKQQTSQIAKKINVKGLINIQFALKENQLYILEVNPRGSRTIPFVSKATGIDWVNIATKVILEKSLKKLKVEKNCWEKLNYTNIKEVVFPFDKFQEEDTLLGPEMKSTGEVMGIGKDLGEAYYKAQEAIGQNLPLQGSLLVTVKSKNHLDIIHSCRSLYQAGFKIYATEGTANFLKKHHIDNQFIHKMSEGRPDIRDIILNGEIKLIFNIPIGKKAKKIDRYIRTLAQQHRIPIVTTIYGIKATTEAIITKKKRDFKVRSIQKDIFKKNKFFLKNAV